MTYGHRTTPDVTAVIQSNGGAHQLVLTSPYAREITLPMARPDAVSGRNVLLADHIAKFLRAFPDRIPTRVGLAAQQLDGLAVAARVYLGNVFAESFDSIDAFTAFLRKACPSWQTALPRVPMIHAISSLDDYFPWEFLPLFDPYSGIEATTLPELADACRRFLGFGAIVERRGLTDRDVDTTLNATHSLPIRVIYDASYPGAQAELGFLRAQGPGVHIEGPYPLPGGSGVGTPTLAQQLRDPTLGVDGKPRDRPDQIVHFSCHCETPRSQPPDNYMLRLAGENGITETVRLDKLIDEMIQARPWGDPDRRDRMPLVFLNACGTSVVDPHGAAAFLKRFADNRNRGFIGTMTNVPDRIAARMSHDFYSALFSGRTASEALHSAKWKLLYDYSNPLGIVYSLYGEAFLRVLPVIEPVTA